LFEYLDAYHEAVAQGDGRAVLNECLLEVNRYANPHWTESRIRSWFHNNHKHCGTRAEAPIRSAIVWVSLSEALERATATGSELDPGSGFSLTSGRRPAPAGRGYEVDWTQSFAVSPDYDGRLGDETRRVFGSELASLLLLLPEAPEQPIDTYFRCR
jgi:hypothetical protein